MVKMDSADKTGDAEGIEFTESMYRENILDHFRHPRNFGRLDKADAKSHGSNPLCGDEI